MRKRSNGLMIAILIVLQFFLPFSAHLPVQAAETNLSGTVTDETGTPLAGIELVVFAQQSADPGHKHWLEAARTTTDGNGHYTVAGLQPGSYLVDLSETAKRSGQALIMIDDLAPMRAAHATPQTTAQGSLTGTLTNHKGKSAKQVAVSLYAVINQNDYSYEQLLRRTLTDDKGRYKFRDLPAGQYKLGFADTFYPERYVVEYYPDAADPWMATVIDFTGNNLRIDAQLAPAGSIAGRVTNAQGSALAGIGVELNRYIDDGYGYFYWQTVNGISTISDGTYQFTGLLTGIYRLRYVDNNWPLLYAPEYYNNAAALESATDVVVIDGTNVTAIDVQLARAGQIAGTVTDENGQPLEGIGVTLYDDADGDGYWQSTYSSWTDAQGTYVVGGLPAGIYRVEFTDWIDWMMWPPRYQTEFYINATTVESATNVQVGEGAIVNGIDAQLAPLAHIQGQVTNAAGQPLGNAAVSVYMMEESGDYWYPMYYSASTDGMGFYDLGGLPAGNYRVGFAYSWEQQPVEYYNDVASLEDAATITLSSGQTVTNIDAQLVNPGAIEGIVTDSTNQPIANVVINALRQSLLPDGTVGLATAGSVWTDGSGAYRFSSLAPGQYLLEFGDYNNWPRQYSSEYYDNATDLTGATPVMVTAGATSSGINAQLALTGAIDGQVLDATGAPVADIYVTALRLMSDGSGNSYWSQINSAITDGTGAYTLRGLDVGTYRMLFQDATWPRRYSTVYYNNVADLQNAQDLTIAAGAQVHDINAQMAVGSQLSGIVTDQAGGVLADLNVVLFRASTDGSGNLIWDYYGDTMTQADGSYTLTALSAGRYRIGFFDWREQYQSIYYENAGDVESATDIQVDGQQAVSGINVQLLPFAAVNIAPVARNDKVTVTAASASVVAGRTAKVDLNNVLGNDRDPNGDSITAQLVTNAEHGTVTLNGDGTFVYTTDHSGVRSDRFTYRVTDGLHVSNTATVEITIAAPPVLNYKVLMPLIQR